MTQPVVRRTPERVPLSAIHNALQQEWSSLSADVEVQTGAPPLRANTSTLVVITEQGPGVENARKGLHQLASAIPSRVIFFVLDAASEQPAATIWAHCTLTAHGTHGGCYDVIEIDLPPDRVRAIPNIVAVHRLGELPTFLYWNGQVDIASEMFASVTSVADRLVIDSESFDFHLDELRNYANYISVAGPSACCSDLAWTRIATWRELIAQSFDPPGTRNFAPEIQSIDITYDESQDAGTMLLASWLVSRLGLIPVDASNSTERMEFQAASADSDHRLTINLHHSHRSGQGIRSVRLLARSGPAIARISIVRNEDDTCTARVESPGMPRQERVVQHTDPTRGELIAAELTHYRRRTIYEEALATAAHFCRLLDSNFEQD